MSGRKKRRLGNTPRVLVTGGAGFLGSHLCEALLRQDKEVICLDNFFCSTKRNIVHLLGDPRFELIRHDVTIPIWLEVDQIYNLACPASPIHYQHNPIKTIKASVMGSINMLGLAKRVGARVLQTSTSEIYGDPLEHPQREEYWGNVNPIGPRSSYDEGKRVAESLFMNYHLQNRVDIRIVRIFNTYGPRMHPDDGRLVSNLIVQALRGEPLTVYGDGSQSRSFCYVDDLIAGLIAMMEQEKTIGPVNLGNPAEYSVGEMASLVLELTGSRSEVVHRPRPVDDPTRRQPDIARARELLGWEPRTPLREGLARTVEYFRASLKED